MNRQEILKLVREHFKGGGVCDDGSCTEYYGDPDAFVKFAQAIYQEGFDEGRYEQVLEHMNYPEDYFTG